VGKLDHSGQCQWQSGRLTQLAAGSTKSTRFEFLIWNENIGVVFCRNQRSNPWHLWATERSECSHLNQGSGLMPDYRAYIVGSGGPFNSVRAEFLHNYPDDTTAIEAAKQLVHDYDVELWDGDRFVGRFSPEAK
jgi:hypothetical protein